MENIIKCERCLYWHPVKGKYPTGTCECVPEEWLTSDVDDANIEVVTLAEDFCSLATK